MQDQNEPRSAVVADAPAEPAAGGDVLAGLLFAALGLAALWGGWAYPAGSSLDMGPGYLPRLVCGALALTGIVMVCRNLRSRSLRLPALPMRAMGCVAAAILLFAVLVERAGLFVACLVCVLTAALGDPLTRWREVPVVAVVFAGVAALLFGYLLKLPIRIWPL